MRDLGRAELRRQPVGRVVLRAEMSPVAGTVDMGVVGRPELRVGHPGFFERPGHGMPPGPDDAVAVLDSPVRPVLVAVARWRHGRVEATAFGPEFLVGEGEHEFHFLDPKPLVHTGGDLFRRVGKPHEERAVDGVEGQRRRFPFLFKRRLRPGRHAAAVLDGIVLVERLDDHTQPVGPRHHRLVPHLSIAADAGGLGRSDLQDRADGTDGGPCGEPEEGRRHGQAEAAVGGALRAHG